jgi:hypothetical protein
MCELHSLLWSQHFYICSDCSLAHSGSVPLIRPNAIILQFNAGQEVNVIRV